MPAIIPAASVREAVVGVLLMMCCSLLWPDDSASVVKNRVRRGEMNQEILRHWISHWLR